MRRTVIPQGTIIRFNSKARVGPAVKRELLINNEYCVLKCRSIRGLRGYFPFASGMVSKKFVCVHIEKELNNYLSGKSNVLPYTLFMIDDYKKDIFSSYKIKLEDTSVVDCVDVEHDLRRMPKKAQDFIIQSRLLTLYDLKKIDLKKQSFALKDRLEQVNSYQSLRLVSSGINAADMYALLMFRTRFCGYCDASLFSASNTILHYPDFNMEKVREFLSEHCGMTTRSLEKGGINSKYLVFPSIIKCSGCGSPHCLVNMQKRDKEIVWEVIYLPGNMNLNK